MVSAINTALAGLVAANKRIDTAAKNIAEPTKAIDNGDNEKDIVDLSVSAQAFKANLSVIKKTDEMQQNLLDILA